MKWMIFWAAWGVMCIAGAVLSTASVSEALYGLGAFFSGMNVQRYLSEWLAR